MRTYPSTMQHGSGATMTLDRSRLLLAFVEPVRADDIEGRLRELTLRIEDAADTEREQHDRPFDIVNHTDRRIWIRESSGAAIDAGRAEALEGTFSDRLQWIGPVYRLAGTQGRGGLLCLTSCLSDH
jgi:hypothetical protein